MRLLVAIIAIFCFNTAQTHPLLEFPPLLDMKCTTEIIDHNTMSFGCTNDVKGWWTFTHVQPNGEYVIILDKIWGKDMEILMQATDYVISITLTTYDGRSTFKIVPVTNIIGKRA